MSYAAYKVVHPPTGVTCCASGFLTRSAAAEPLSNLIVSRGNVLQVFSVRSDAVHGEAEGGERKGEAGKDGGSRNDAGNSVLPGATLDVVCEFRLNGVVESITVVPGAAATDAAGWAGTGGGGSNSAGGGGRGAGRGAAGGEGSGRGGRGRGGRQSGRREGRGGAGSAWDPSAALGATGGGFGSGNSGGSSSGSGGNMGYSGRKDALVLTFRDAKVSVVEFDDAVQRLKVSSLHYLEGPEWTARKRGRENFPLPPIARSDWSGRCSAVLVYRCHLHFLTRKQPAFLPCASFNQGPSEAFPVRSFVLLPCPILPNLQVRDFVFLSEPGDPIVAVLWEEGSAWAGRLGGSSPAVLEARFSCAVTFLRVSLHTRSHLILGTTKVSIVAVLWEEGSVWAGRLGGSSPAVLGARFSCAVTFLRVIFLSTPTTACSPPPSPKPLPLSPPAPSLSPPALLAPPTFSPRAPPFLQHLPFDSYALSPAPFPPWSRLVLPPHSLHFRSLRVLKNEPSLLPLPAPPFLQHLPFDSYALSPAPFPPGGLLVLSPHSLHFCSSSSTCHLALNDSSPPALPDGTEIPRPRQQPGQAPLSVELEAAHATWQPVIGPSGGPVGVGGSSRSGGGSSSSSAVAFLASKGGALVVVKVTPEAKATTFRLDLLQVRATVQAGSYQATTFRLDLLQVRATVQASGILSLGPNLLFVASRLGDSMLIRYRANEHGLEKQRGAKRLKADEASDGEGTAAAVPAAPADAAAGAEEEEQGQEGFSFRVCDSLLNIGPIRDLVPVPAFPAPTPQKEQQQQHQMLVACSGHGKNGALSVLLQRVPLDVLTQEDLPGCCGLWTVYGSELPSEAREGGEDGQAAAGEAGGTAVEGEGAGKGGIGGVEGGEQGSGAGAMEVEGGSGVGGGEGGKGDRGSSYHGFLVLAFEGQSMVLETETGELLREVSAEVSFITDAPTLLAANLFSRRCILQVTPSAVRLLASSASLLQEMLPRGMVAGAGEGGGEGKEEGKEGGEDVEIESADVADPYVMLQLVDGRFILLGPDPSKPLSLAGRGGKASLPVGGEATAAAAATTAPTGSVTAGATAGSEAMEVDLKPEKAEKEAVEKKEVGKAEVERDEEMGMKEEKREEGKEEGKEVDVDMDGGSGAGKGAGSGGVKGVGVKVEEKEEEVKAEVKETEASLKTEKDGAERAVAAHTPAPVVTSPSAPDWPKHFAVDLHVSVNPVTGRLFLFVVLSDGRLLGFKAFCPSGASPGDVIAASVTVTGERGARVGGRAGGGGGQGVAEGEPGGRAGSTGVGGLGLGGYGVGGLRFQRVCLEEEEAGIHEVEGEEEDEEGRGERAVGGGAGAGGGGGGEEGRVKQEGGEKGEGESGGGETAGGDTAAEEKAQGEEGAERSRKSGRAAEAASSVVAMAPFHNVNCTHGFLLISSLGVLSICQLPPLFQFDNAWPLNKIPLRSTPHSVTLSPDAAHLFLVTSTPVSRPVSQFLVPSLEDPKDPSTAALGSAGPGGPGAPGASGTGSDKDTEAVSMVEDFQLRVVTCPSLEAPSRALEVRQRFEFQPFEAVTMVKSVVLRNRSSGQLQTLLAVCTTFITGEDAPGKGRILLFEYNPLATADGDGPAAAGTGAAAAADAEGKAAGGSIGIPLLRELYSKEPIAGSSQRGSVAALTALQGNLLLAVGRQLVLYAWNGVELEGIAFLDAPLYVVSMATVKSFVIVGDVLKSVYFLHWREEGAQLTLLARDFSSLPITAVDFLIDGSALGLLATDTAKNLQVFAYSKSIETHMGQKLLLKASFHTGEVLSKVLRLPLPPPLATTAAGGVGGQQRNPAAAASGRTNRFGVLAGTLGGAIAVVTPVPELVFRRLDTVQRYMVTAVEQAAGLHPLAFRAVQGLGKGQQHSGVERVIDSQLLAQ
ncbi:unnamed protein product [Closterium sp. Naga37s-1]|nr:unnamed protein product [Closterium sp. Naga37s-1]